ncbi:unnamed protein product [Protopolystoma xenopodis]|uniref:Uncharacterized protein n=1 Tax=Protopolystoma xenopodis TaxID=117903 RepID=A0A3S5AL05_9PLAT|nr:unnamed protein product [Protopolystoma xenopodis]
MPESCQEQTQTSLPLGLAHMSDTRLTDFAATSSFDKESAPAPPAHISNLNTNASVTKLSPSTLVRRRGFRRRRPNLGAPVIEVNLNASTKPDGSTHRFAGDSVPSRNSEAETEPQLVQPISIPESSFTDDSSNLLLAQAITTIDSCESYEDKSISISATLSNLPQNVNSSTQLSKMMNSSFEVQKINNASDHFSSSLMRLLHLYIKSHIHRCLHTHQSHQDHRKSTDTEVPIIDELGLQENAPIEAEWKNTLLFKKSKGTRNDTAASGPLYLNCDLARFFVFLLLTRTVY